MDNPETSAIFSAYDTGRRQTNQKHTHPHTHTHTHTHKHTHTKDEQHGHHQTTESQPRCSRRVNSPCFLYDTRRDVTHIVNSCERFVGDKGKTKSTQDCIRPLIPS